MVNWSKLIISNKYAKHKWRQNANSTLKIITARIIVQFYLISQEVNNVSATHNKLEENVTKLPKN